MFPSGCEADSMHDQPTLQGVQAVQALLDATPDTPSYMIGIQENKITMVPLLEAVAQVSGTSSIATSKSDTVWVDASCGCRHRIAKFR